MESKILHLLILFLLFNIQKSFGQESSKIIIDFSKDFPTISPKMGALDKNAVEFVFAYKKDGLILQGLKDPTGIKIIFNAGSDENDKIIIDEGVIKTKLNGAEKGYFEIAKSSNPKFPNFGEFVDDPMKGKPIKLPLDVLVTKEGNTLARFNERTSGKIPTTNPAATKSNRYTFIPNLDNYNKLYTEARANEKNRKQSKDDLQKQKVKLNRITYDFKGSHNLYSSRSKYGKLKAGINENVVFEVININPYTHTVVINDTPINLHTEGATQFGQFISIPTPTENIDISEGDKPGSQVSKEVDTLRSYGKLFQELNAFYGKKILTTYPDIDLLAAEIDFIKDNVIQELKIPSSSINVAGSSIKELLIVKGNVFVKDIGNETSRIAYADTILKAAEMYEKITQINYKATSGVIQPKNNDMLRFDLAIKKGNVDVMPAKQYEIMLHGGWKIDFSTGLFWNNLIDHEFTTKRLSFADTTYYLDEYFVTTDSITAISAIDRDSIIRTDNGAYNIGIGILAHLYPRTGSRINLGLTGGFIVGADSRIKYVLGASLILGYEQRFIVSGGIARGQVKRLGAGLQEGDFLNSVTGQTSTVPTRDAVWQNGWFIGITYNLGGANLSGKQTNQ